MTVRRRTLPLGCGYAFHLGTHPGYWNLGRMDVVWRGETIVRGWCFGPFELQHWKHGVNHLGERKYDRLCTSPRRHRCRPGRWRDDHRDGCLRSLHWRHWCSSHGHDDPRVWNYAPIVRVLAGLSWRQQPHLCSREET